MPDNAAPATGAGAPSAPSAAPVAAVPATSAAEPVQATSGSGEPSPQSTVTPSPGANEPPKERWSDILDNARKKTRAEVESEYRNRYGKYDAFEQDPLRAVTQWLDQASNHSLYQGHIQNWVEQYVGKYLESKGGAVGEEPKPDIPVVDQAGNVTHHVYSADQQRAWHKWQRAQDERGLQQRLKPLEDKLSAYERAEQGRAQDAAAAEHLKQFDKYPYFTEHKDKVVQAFVDHPEFGNNFHAAYVHVLANDILPKLSQAEQAKVVDSINQKATAGTVNPNQSAVGSPKFKSFRDAAKYYEEHPEEAAAMANR